MKNRTRIPAPASLLAKLTLALAACGLIAPQIRAQDATDPTPAAPAATAPTPAPIVTERPPYRPITLGVEIGPFTGVGATLGWRFSNHFGVSAGMNYLTWSPAKTIEDIDFALSFKLRHAPLTLDLYPSRASSFHLRLGVAQNGNQISATAHSTSPDETVTLDGIDYKWSDVGKLNATFKQKKTNAYISIAGNFFQSAGRHVSFGGELGLLYGGTPAFEMTRTGGTADPNLDAQINARFDETKAKIRKTTNQITFWPVLKLALRFSF